MSAEAQILTILNILVALHLSRALYKFTLFMQNKPNLLDAQMNVSSVKTMNYEQITMNNANKNKPNLSRRSLWRSRIKSNFCPKNPTLDRSRRGQSRNFLSIPCTLYAVRFSASSSPKRLKKNGQKM